MANKLGVHSLVFTEDWSEGSAKRAIDSAAKLGFDIIEVLIFDPAAVDAAMTKRLAKAAGIEVALGMALGPETDISSLNGETASRRRGNGDPLPRNRGGDRGRRVERDRLRRFQPLFGAANSGSARPGAGGVGAARCGRRRKGTPAWTGGRQSIRVVHGQHARRGRRHDPRDRREEPLHSYGHVPYEHRRGDVAGAVARNADLLGYAHVAENTRGALGAGSFDFKVYFRSLARAGYAGGITLESFSNALVGPGLCGAIGLWRRQWSDSEAAAGAALAFLRAELASAAAASLVW